MVIFKRRFFFLLLVLVANFVVATVGYMWIEGWSLLEAFYMTTITLTTVGYGEVRPLSADGRLFTSILLLVSLGVVAYSFSVLGELALTMKVGSQLRRRRMERTIRQLEQHIIICGYGRVGQSAVETILESQRLFCNAVLL